MPAAPTPTYCSRVGAAQGLQSVDRHSGTDAFTHSVCLRMCACLASSVLSCLPCVHVLLVLYFLASHFSGAAHGLKLVDRHSRTVAFPHSHVRSYVCTSSGLYCGIRSYRQDLNARSESLDACICHCACATALALKKDIHGSVDACICHYACAQDIYTWIRRCVYLPLRLRSRYKYMDP